jgi:hypothetical protein
MRVHDISNYMVGAMDDDIGQVGAWVRGCVCWVLVY